MVDNDLGSLPTASKDGVSGPIRQNGCRLKSVRLAKGILQKEILRTKMSCKKKDDKPISQHYFFLAKFVAPSGSKPGAMKIDSLQAKE